MPGKTPSMLNRQPQHIRNKIIEMAGVQHIDAIVMWLNEHGINANYNQVRYFISTHNPTPKPQPIEPVKGYAEKVRVYIDALLEYDTDTYIIKNLRLYGPSWTQVTMQLYRDGLIEPIRVYTPMRWRILASKEELKEWCDKEVTK